MHERHSGLGFCADCFMQYWLFLRFVPDKEFSGTDRSQKREGPVQFEKAEDDIFGLTEFLQEAKKAEKRPADDRGSRNKHDRKRDRRE